MYRVMIGDDIEPFRSKEELRAWREREGVFVTLVDRVTRSLSATREPKVLPMGVKVPAPTTTTVDMSARRLVPSSPASAWEFANLSTGTSRPSGCVSP